MPLLRQDAERGLSLLWEFLPVAYASECTQGFSQAISGLHLFLTDVLPASQPCIRAKVEVSEFFCFFCLLVSLSVFVVVVVVVFIIIVCLC